MIGGISKPPTGFTIREEIEVQPLEYIDYFMD